MVNIPNLWSESTEKAFRTVYDALYVDRGESYEQVIQDWKTYSPCIISPVGGALNNWDSFLIESDSGARYLWLDPYQRIVHEAILGIGEFEARIREFLNWFDKYVKETWGNYRL